MIIAVTGSSGLVGTALRNTLTAHGDVIQPVRRTPTEDGIGDFAPLPACDAVVHLAGESVAGRWPKAKRQRIRDSRVVLTDRLIERIRALEQPPKVLIGASAIGLYGDRGDEVLTEASAPGAEFLAGVVRDWEAAVAAATELGIRVVHLRIGVALSMDGGALQQMRTPFRSGLGGRLGSGRQWMSWIHLDDLVRMIVHALDDSTWHGVYNAVAPQPVTNAEFTRELGRALRRPTILPVPRFALRLLFGQMADELLLASARVAPERALAGGFTFDFERLDEALAALTSGTRPAPRS